MKQQKVLIAGGLCGGTMMSAAQKVKEAAAKADLYPEVETYNLWEGTDQYGAHGFDVVVEMFPYFEKLDCLLLSGKPFIARQGEKELIEQIINYLKEHQE